MICRPGWQIGLLGSAFFGGWVTTLLWVPKLVDMYGKIQVVRVSAGISVALYILLLFSTSYKLNVACMYFHGFVHSCRLGVGYPYLMELVGKQYRAHYSSVMTCGAALWGVTGTLYFLYISTNAYYLLAVGCIGQLTSFIGCLYLPESPVYLLHQGKI